MPRRSTAVWLITLCRWLGVHHLHNILSIEGISALRLLAKKHAHYRTDKVEWFLQTNWDKQLRVSPDRQQSLHIMMNQWQQHRRHSVVVVDQPPPSPTRRLLRHLQHRFRGLRRSTVVASSVPQESLPPSYRRKIWVSIGIDDYVHMPSLRSAVNDATHLATFAKEQLRFQCTTLLLDAKATKDRVETYIKQNLFSYAGPNDLVVITFHGHGKTLHLRGVDCGFIMLRNSAGDDPSDMISMSDLENWTRYLAARHVLIVLDCCFSGIISLRGNRRNTSKNTTVVPPPLYTDATVRNHLDRDARIVINAGSSDQQTLDGGWHNNSMLTGALMSYANFAITRGAVSPLFGYLSHTVSSKCAQTPTLGKLVGDKGGEIFLAL